MTTKDTKKRYIEAVGRRKEAIARVRITPSSKTTFIINTKTLEEYFPIAELRAIVKRPLSNIEPEQNFSISIVTKGGGIHSQADSCALGLARALVLVNPTWKNDIKKSGLLTRDARIKERRKFGLKKARKAPQWSKR
ncbi:MAG: 30S ribosomal protein S9 [Candidatus Paceibacterota bacterium]